MKGEEWEPQGLGPQQSECECVCLCVLSLRGRMGHLTLPQGICPRALSQSHSFCVKGKGPEGEDTICLSV